jgi:hypothetical protein
MIKLASFALAGALGVAGLVSSLPAAACPTVGVVAPRVGAAMPVAYFPGPYRPYYGHGRFWHRGYEHFDRFHHRWY